DGAVRLPTFLRETVVERLALGRAVRVPAPVEELYEADPLLHQPPREDAVVGEARLSRYRPVHRVHPLRLTGQVHHLWDGELHPEGHLELGDAGQRLRIADLLVLALV